MKITSAARLGALFVAIALMINPLESWAATPKAAGLCTKVNQRAKISGAEYVCSKSGKKLIWVKVKQTPAPQPKPSPSPSQSQSQSQGSGQQQQQGNFVLGQLGAACSKNGEIAWNGFLVAACKNGVVKYALSSDVPKAPAGGFKSRPSWYPTLTQVMQGGSSTEPTCKSSTITFTHPVVPLAEMAPSIPYGMMVSGHVTPIDHGYFGIKALSKSPSQLTDADYVKVTAPADGVITELSNLGSPNSNRVRISHGCGVYTVYMVLNKPSGVLAKYADELATKGYVQLNVAIKAGEEFGSQRDTMLDFNVFAADTWLSGFANPGSYLSAETSKPYTADFLPFFKSDIRTVLEGFMQRTSAPRSGKIDHDVVGAAAGNWFLDGTNGYAGNFNSAYENATTFVPTGFIPGKNEYSWNHLAIAPHEVDTAHWIFSTGWFADPKGDATQALMVISGSQVQPDKLTSSSGVVVYELAQASPILPVGSAARTPGSQEPWPIGYTVGPGRSLGIVALQVNADNSLTIEIIPGATSATQFTGFTANKRTYTR